MVTTFDKAIVALVVPLIVAAAAHFGFAASDEVVASLSVLITAIVVYLVPNKVADLPAAPVAPPATPAADA